MKRIFSILAALSMVVAFAASAVAVPLVPGTSNFRPGLASGPPFYTLGPVPAFFNAANQVGTLNSNFTELGISQGITGSVTSTAYADPNNNNCLGFEYVFTTTPSVPNAVLIRAALAGQWTGVAISDAGSDQSGSSTPGGGGAVWADGSPNFILRDPVGDEDITFQWRAGSDGTVLDGNNNDVSASIWVVTDAKGFAQAGVGLIDSDAVSGADVLAPSPVQAIPEPGLMILLGSGLLGIAGVSRKRRKK